MTITYQWTLKNLHLEIRTSDAPRGYEAKRIHWYHARGWELIDRKEQEKVVRLTFRRQSAE